MLNSYFSPLISCESASVEANTSAVPLSIRQAESRDLHSLAEVLTSSFHPPQGILWWMSPLLKLGVYEDLRTRLQSSSPHYTCLVASRGGNPLGSKQEEILGTVEIALRTVNPWSMSASQFPYISNLAVSSAYRRQGIARQLLLKCEQIAQDWGFDSLSLHVLEDNYQARQLYSRTGYQLHRIETSFDTWLFRHPRRLFLNKKVS